MDRTKPRPDGPAALLAAVDGPAPADSAPSPFNGLTAQLLDALPFMILMLDSERRIVHSNASAMRFLDLLSRDEVLGKLPSEALGCARPGDSSKPCGESEACRLCGAKQALAACLDGQAGVRDCRITTRQGSRRRSLDLKVWANPLVLGGRRYTVFSFMDMSLEHRQRMLERVFFHDVANTLAGLKGIVGLIEEEDGRVEPRDLEILRASVDQLSEEIVSQRDLAAAERGDLVVSTARLSSLELLARIREGFRRRKAARDKSLDIDPTAADVRFESDPVLLKRVLGNMVLNALEASLPSQSVVIGCEPPAPGSAQGPTFWVRNAEPMPGEVAQQIFQHSFSTKGQGRGLGTYSLKLLGEDYLGGAVSFETGPDRGTIFRIALPARIKKRGGTS